MSRRRLLYCPLDRRGFDSFTEFWAHVTRKHEPLLNAEADRLTVEMLARGDRRRRARERERFQRTA